MFEVELLAVAETELSDSYDWYESELPSLGRRFYKEVAHYLDLIKTNPFLFPVRYAEELRVAPVIKFPFIIIYWIDELNQKVFVISIFHTSRNPKHF